MSKSAARLRSISENVQRRALDPDDTGEVFYELYQQEKNLGRVAELLGVSVPTVTKYLGYRTLPTWLKEAVLARGLTVAKAVRLWNFSQHDEAKAKAIVERMPSMTKNEIDRLLILYEANPEEDPDQLVEKARKEKYLPRIIIHLPPRYALGLSNAAADTDREPEDIARRAVMDWLEENGYV
jgi:predicted transcriptional regulator